MSRIVRMTRADSGTPWGFRLQGGRDFNSALTIQKVSKGGMAQRHGVCVGDLIVSIGGDPASHWTHQQAQQAVIRCGNELELGVVTGGSNHYYAPSPQQAHYPHYQAASAAPCSPTVRQSTASWLPATAAAAAPLSPRLAVFPAAGHQAPQPPQHQFNRYPSSPGSSGPYSPTPPPPPPPPPPPQPLPSAGPASALSGRSRRGAAQRRMPQQAGSIPICAACGSVIRGPFLVALDKCFCPDHFNCCVCCRNLEHCGFVEEANQLYCEDDYVRLLAPRCGGCQQTIVTESVHAMEQYFHRQCFVCAHCRQSIAGKKFRVEDNRPYCEKDWGDLFFTKCAKCHEAIAPIDRFVEVLGGTYHAECFCCAVCGTCLEGKPFAPKDGKAYCKLHARRF